MLPPPAACGLQVLARAEAAGAAHLLGSLLDEAADRPCMLWLL